MIVPQDASKSELSTQRAETVPDVAPPAYEPHSDASWAPSHIMPTNFIAIKRRFGEVKDTFVLNPALVIPHPMRPRNQRVHLSLSALMGEVAAVVYIVGSESLQKGLKTRMEVFSTMGTTRLELHAPEPRAALSVNVSARLGEVNLQLPRSFRGSLQISAKLGEVQISPALRAATRSFGDSLFVGEWKESELKEDSWKGDEAVVYAKLGSVFVGYSDENMISA
ncbi:hypothetical protein B0H11DRAFT_1946609 [Mycena galericulata]|nr:hypothetical protein B0H11DRAFT_1946609 [Mycena galericulata]